MFTRGQRRRATRPAHARRAFRRGSYVTQRNVSGERWRTLFVQYVPFQAQPVVVPPLFALQSAALEVFQTEVTCLTVPPRRRGPTSVVPPLAR